MFYYSDICNQGTVEVLLYPFLGGFKSGYKMMGEGDEEKNIFFSSIPMFPILIDQIPEGQISKKKSSKLYLGSQGIGTNKG